MSKALLFYNLYPKSKWEEITASILAHVPHDDIIVHVTLPFFPFFRKRKVIKELKKYPKIKQVLFSNNIKKEGESIGLRRLQKEIDLTPYTILTYAHSKGSSKPRKNTQPIKDWTELMRYFVVQRLDLAKKAFDDGYYLYGANLFDTKHEQIPTCTYYYAGTFVSVNLKYLAKKVKETPCLKSYYGVEAFWGTLCTIDKAFCVHRSGINHYEEEYPPSKYLLKSIYP